LRAMRMTRKAKGHRLRYRRIAEVLAHHGLGYLIGVAGLGRFVPLRRTLLGSRPSAPPTTAPEHLRMALEELGPTFIKLGQILSTRSDLIPPEFEAQLARLQDAAPAVPWEAMEERLVAELGCPTHEVFQSINQHPLAAASIGQVHEGVLLDGTQVVVKIRRPGVVEEIEEDLEILESLAVSASRHSELAERYDVVGLAQEFAQTLRAELDYVREGRSAERFATNFAHHSEVHIPKIFWSLTTERILVLERLRGTKIDDIAGLEAAGVDRRMLAERAAHVLLKMIFEDGFFHADPHPGNFFVECDGRLGLIDFGMVGTVDDETRQQLVELLLAITSQNADRLVDALLDLGVAGQRIERQALERDVEHLVSRYYGRPIGEIAIGPVIREALDIIRQHDLHLPPSLALLVKTLIMNEGIGTRLDPDFRLSAVLAPYAERLVLQQYSPFLWARRIGRSSLDAMRLGTDLPHHARRIMGDLERGSIEIGMRPRGIEPIIARFERLANRLVLGMLAAAFVNGLAVLMASYRLPGVDPWIPSLIGTGFLMAGVLGAYLVWTILRTGRG